MISAKEMTELEHWATQQGLSVEELMENAGRAVFETVKEKYDLADKQIVLFCGQGNNGGDGFVAARYFGEEARTLVLFFGDKEKLSEEAELNYNKIRLALPVIKIGSKEDLIKFKFQKGINYLLIDAIFGIGLALGAKGKIREPFSSGIELFNSIPGIKVAVDLPSGMDADTGEAVGEGGEYCQADLIVCFHELKKGLEKFQDKTVIVDIGIPTR